MHRHVRRWTAASFCCSVAVLLAAGACAHPTRGAVGLSPAAADSAARAAIASERSISVNDIPARAVAVPPMAVAATDTTIAPLGYGLADLLATDLSQSDRLTVVDRARLDAMLRELALGQSGQVDSSTAPRVGKLVGARRLVIGAIDQLPNGNLVLNAKIGDVVTGRIVTAVNAQAPLDRVLDAESALAFRIFDALGVTLTPAQRVAIAAHPTQNVAALLAYSRGVEAETHGDMGAAARQYEAALRADPGFARAQAHLSAVQNPTIASGAPAPRASTPAAAGNAAAVQALASVNPSLADVNTGGAAAAVAQAAVNPATAVTRALIATVIIVVRPLP